jgi:hypothetical protein
VAGGNEAGEKPLEFLKDQASTSVRQQLQPRRKQRRLRSSINPRLCCLELDAIARDSRET